MSEQFGPYTAHPAAAAFPILSHDELQDLAHDIATHGQQEPCVVWEDWLVDGRNRWRACELVKVKPLIAEHEFDNEAQLIAWVISRNLHRRHLSTSQRSMLGAQMLDLFRQNADQRLPGERPRDSAARAVNVSPRSVTDAAKVYASGDDALIARVMNGDISVSKAAAELRRRASVIKAVTSSQSHEWYTPEPWPSLARQLMGAIDLDPASCAEANEIVKATHIFTKDDDGLLQTWFGRVWNNPPYGLDEEQKSVCAKWVRKAIESYRSGAVEQLMLLVNSSTGTGWFAPLWDFPLCFPYKRIRFVTPRGVPTKDQPTHASAIAYLGPHVEEFERIMKPHGRVVMPAGDVSRSVQP